MPLIYARGHAINERDAYSCRNSAAAPVLLIIAIAAVSGFGGIFGSLISAATIYGQIKSPTAATIARIETAAEADEAFKQFDFDRLKINPNNLTRRMIADLRKNFLAEVKSKIIDEGDYPKRLQRIAAPLFRFHKTAKSETVVFTHPVPTVFTWKETFVTVSTGALDLLTDEEIAALVSHEIGHLYYAEDLGKARAGGDERAERIIELRCDLAALVTLSKLNIEPSNLISAVKRLVEKRARLKTESFQTGSPSLGSRERVYELYMLAEPAKKP